MDSGAIDARISGTHIIVIEIWNSSRARAGPSGTDICHSTGVAVIAGVSIEGYGIRLPLAQEAYKLDAGYWCWFCLGIAFLPPSTTGIADNDIKTAPLNRAGSSPCNGNIPSANINKDPLADRRHQGIAAGIGEGHIGSLVDL